MAVTQDLDVSMSTHVEFVFRFGCHGDDEAAGWPLEESVLVQYSTNGGMWWTLLKELHHAADLTPRCVCEFPKKQVCFTLDAPPTVFESTRCLYPPDCLQFVFGCSVRSSANQGAPGRLVQSSSDVCRYFEKPSAFLLQVLSPESARSRPDQLDQVQVLAAESQRSRIFVIFVIFTNAASRSTLSPSIRVCTNRTVQSASVEGQPSCLRYPVLTRCVFVQAYISRCGSWTTC